MHILKFVFVSENSGRIRILLLIILLSFYKSYILLLFEF